MYILSIIWVSLWARMCITSLMYINCIKIATLKKIEQSNSPEVTFWEDAIDVQEKRTGTTSKTSWHDVDNMIPACEENKANPRLTCIHTIHRSHPSTVTVKALKRPVAPDTPVTNLRMHPRS